MFDFYSENLLKVCIELLILVYNHTPSKNKCMKVSSTIRLSDLDRKNQFDIDILSYYNLALTCYHLQLQNVFI